MRPSSILASCVLVLALCSGGAFSSTESDRAWDGECRAVHEWGTFTAVQGSTGIRLEGLFHDAEDLPSFVYDVTRAGAINAFSPKMETPVIYFYSRKRWDLALRVDFPHGRITHWFPRASSIDGRDGLAELPGVVALAAGSALAGGSIAWGEKHDLTILAAGEPAEFLPVREGDAWRFARDVGANALAVRNLTAVAGPEGPWPAHQPERFLFYRGLGDFALPLAVHVVWERHHESCCQVSLRLVNSRPDEPLTRLFLICVSAGEAGFRELPDLLSELDLGPVELALAPIEETSRELVERVTARLATTGLYSDEARAMARTWAASWFRDPGMRILCVLPRQLVDRELPMSITVHAQPSESGVEDDLGPDEIVRTFVARTEILTPERERELVLVLADFAAGDERARQQIESWGRLAIPYLMRARELATDPALVAAIERELNRRAARH